MTKLLLIDFDRTIFDTSRFAEAWWRWAAQAYNIDVPHEMGRMEEYFNYAGVWRNYDFYRHLGDMKLSVPVEQILAEGRQALADQDFTYPDAKTVFKMKPTRPMELVTFGNHNYQSYKISFVPELETWVRHVTEVEKGDYLRVKFGNQLLILVDDKDLVDELAPSVEFIHLDRSQKADVIRHDGFMSIRTLKFVKEAIDEVY